MKYLPLLKVNPLSVFNAGSHYASARPQCFLVLLSCYAQAAERTSCKQLKVGEQFIVSEFKPIAEMQLYNQEMLRKHFMLSVERKVSRPS